MTVVASDPLARARRRIAAWDPHIHAFVTLCEASAEVEGPLSGITVGVKDIIDVAGVPTRNGSEACRDAPAAARDAPVVAALRAAGACIVGKTTTTEYAFTDPTPCRNPHDLRRTPGGSSSGSGAAVAAGLVDIALGTQTAGSLCRPAAYCGCVGFKPTAGVVPTGGVTPLAPSFDTVGIIARSVALAARAFAVMVPVRAHGEPLELADVRALCGLWQTEVAPEEDAAEALRDAAAALGQVYHAALEAEVAPIVTAHRTVMNFEAAAAHGAMLGDARGTVLKPKFLAGLRAGAAISPEAVDEAKALLAQAKTAFWAELRDVDLVLTLPTPDGPPLLDGTTGYQDWLTPWTVFGGPLLCLPWGADRLGRPRSVMLAARPGRDAWLLAVGGMLEGQAPKLEAPKLPG